MGLSLIWMRILWIAVPFLGTILGAAAVFFVKNGGAGRLRRGTLGFAAGVMLAAMVWSLLMPAIDLAEARGGLAWGAAVLGFLAGVGGLLLLDRGLDRLEARGRRISRAGKGSGSLLLLLAVTLHNLPEGMAVGVALAGMHTGRGMTAAGAAALSIGIAVQNIPEGAIISAPLAAGGMGKGRAFAWGVLSGAVEPVGAVLMLALSRWLGPMLPYVLAFAAGTMLYVVTVELIPEIQSGEASPVGAVTTALGFALMMLLDVALG